jgi:threonine dehydrogenase-like Zn-dependent dehydrogenase
MKAICWHGKHDVRLEEVRDPEIVNDRDAIVRVTATAICGSDLHLYNGVIPTMRRGDVLGHEFMGEVVETGSGVRTLRKGDRVVVPFAIACGSCGFCSRELWSLCDNTNPNATIAEAVYGYSGSGLFGYSHMYGGYSGGQAEYVRVPFADVGPLKVEDDVDDEQVLFLSDIFPTGYMAAENCDIQPDDVIAVWGCGPVGQFAIKSAFLLGAGRVIAIDCVPSRLRLAMNASGADTINFREEDVLERLRDMTGGRGPDACIDAVGLESARLGNSRCRLRSREGRHVAGDRPVGGAPPGDHGVPQGRNGVDSGSLRRLPGQGAVWRRVRERPDTADGSDARSPVSAPVDGADHGRCHRPGLRDQPPPPAGGWPGSLRHVLEEAAGLHEGGAAALVGLQHLVWRSDYPRLPFEPDDRDPGRWRPMLSRLPRDWRPWPRPAEA